MRNNEDDEKKSVASFLEEFRSSISKKDYKLSKDICKRYHRIYGADRNFLRWSMDVCYRTGDKNGCLTLAQTLVSTFNEDESNVSLAFYLWRLNRPQEALDTVLPIVFDKPIAEVSASAMNTFMEASLRLSDRSKLESFIDRLTGVDIWDLGLDKDLYLSCLAQLEYWQNFDPIFARVSHPSPLSMTRRHLSLLLFRSIRSRSNDLPRETIASSLSESMHIFQYWNNLNTIPNDVLKATNTWRTTASGRHTLYDRKTATSFLLEHFGSVAVDAFNSSAHPAQEADLVRLAWLYINGGVYVDADTWSNENFMKTTITVGRSIALWHRDNLPPHSREIVNSFMIAKPRQKFVLRLFETACHNLRGSRRGIWHDTGPGLLTSMVLMNDFDEQIDLMPTADVLGTSLSQGDAWSYKNVSGGKWQDAPG